MFVWELLNNKSNKSVYSIELIRKDMERSQQTNSINVEKLKQ